MTVKQKVYKLFYQLLLLLALYIVCRIIFVCAHFNSLQINSATDFFIVFFGGVRFDLSAIFASNLIYIILYLLPFGFTENEIYKKIISTYFILINAFCIMLNLIDVAYFSFIQKRMQFDVTGFITGEKGNDLFKLLPSFFVDYWYLFLVYILLLWILIKGYKKTKYTKPVIYESKYLVRSIIFILAAGISIISIRGGFQLKPLNIIHASQMASVANIPAVLNSPFSFMKTMNKKGIKRVEYFPPETISSVHNFSTGNFRKLNIVIILIESLSSKYVNKSTTPFLDSLFQNSLYFTNAYANARESIQGIPAVIASIPSWQDEAFIFSPYSTNSITSFPSLLKPFGYKSFFFHGGTNGTMGFNSFSSLAGFDKYYGRSEFSNEVEFDGNWGIWDEPFLKFMASKLKETSQPFISAYFTLNPHHPFIVPKKYKDKFKNFSDPFLNTLEYEDYALREFFNSVQSEEWFRNTLFIFTADHTSPVTEGVKTILDNYHVPIAFYLPGNSLKGLNNLPANQVDILPTTMDLINFPNSFFSLGNSLFKQENNTAVFYNSGVFTQVAASNILQFNSEKVISFYNYPSDSLMKTNDIGIVNPDTLLKYKNILLRKIQTFNNSMLDNKMH
ncbi:MAG: LTA synthase family protein [Bacteroidetes bacterium]|nr:LTA synthase family protein [Bacteroidota bacterium]